MVVMYTGLKIEGGGRGRGKRRKTFFVKKV
jgi:hypothetical protein